MLLIFLQFVGLVSASINRRYQRGRVSPNRNGFPENDGETMQFETAASFALPEDAERAVLVGRVFRPDVDGPSVVAVRGAEVVDISYAAPTMRDLCDGEAPVRMARRSTTSSPTRRPNFAIQRNHSCSPRSTSRRSRQPASPSQSRCSNG